MNTGVPPTPGVYRVREPRAAVWYRRWDGRTWRLGGATPAEAWHSTDAAGDALPWGYDAECIRFNAQKGLGGVSQTAYDLALAGAGRAAVRAATGLTERTARTLVERAPPARGAERGARHAHNRLDALGRALDKMARA